MNWFRSEKGDGFWHGLKRRPSTWLLVSVLLMLGLQIFPGTGIYLMFFGGSLWTGLLVVGFLVAVFVEALLGYLPRFWLLLPVGPLVAYYSAGALQRSNFAARERLWTAENSTAPSSFDPTSDALVLNHHGALMNDRREAAVLLHDYELPVIYIARQRGSYDRLEYKSADQCRPPARELEIRPGMSGMPGLREITSYCLIEDRAPPGRMLVATRQVDVESNWFGTDATIRRTMVSTQDEVVGTYTDAEAIVRGWIPLVAIGCGLAGGAWWQCDSAPLFREVLTLGAAPAGQAGRDPVAIMLGLAPRGGGN